METHPRHGCHKASSRCSFSDPLSGVSEVSDLILVIYFSSASVPTHCLPLLCKPSLHQPDGLKCADYPPPNKLQFPISCRVLDRYSKNMLWTERFTEQEDMSNISFWHQFYVASVFRRGGGGCGAGVTSLKPLCLYICLPYRESCWK